MPFPSPQGTQAAVRAMLTAEADAGLTPTLLSYAHGGEGAPAPGRHLRLPELVGDRSLKSGPSWRKVLQDAQLAWALRGIGQRPVIAHHVEAAAAAWLASARPFVFFAHTALGPELPMYLPEAFSAAARRSGNGLDGALLRAADHVCALSPQLCAQLARVGGRGVPYVPVPWRVPRETAASLRGEARHRLGLDEHAEVLLYAGNLDRYQGLEQLIGALAQLAPRRPDLRLLVATGSARDPFVRGLRAAGVRERVTFTRARDEAERSEVHAACDVAVIPRRSPGGLPIKLLDALARGVPTVATTRATAGLPLGAALAAESADDEPGALARALENALARREPVREEGRAYVAEAHHPERYLATMDDLLD